MENEEKIEELKAKDAPKKAAEEKQEEINNLGVGPTPAERWTNDTSSIAGRKTVPGTTKGLEGLSDILKGYRDTIEKEGATLPELDKMKRDLETLVPEALDVLNSVNKAMEKANQKGLSNGEKVRIDEKDNVRTADGRPIAEADNKGAQETEYSYNEPTLNAPGRQFNAGEHSLAGQKGVASVSSSKVSENKEPAKQSNTSDTNITVTNPAYYKRQSEGR